MLSILKIFKWHLLPNRKSDWAETWWEASEQHRDSEWLKSFCSDIQDGCYSGHLENLETTSAPKWYVRLSWNLVGGIGETWKFKTAKFIPFRHLRLKFFKWHLLPNCNADWAKAWLAASEWQRDSGLLKLFWSHIWDGPQGGHLENQTSFAP